MKATCLLALIGWLFALSSSAKAYELATHAKLSREAVGASVLDSSAFRARLNLPGLDEAVFPDQPTGGGEKRAIRTLVPAGAVKEDTEFTQHRVFNHFFDPLNGEGLHFGFLPLGLPSPLWALEQLPASLTFQPPIQSTIVQQTHSFNDARRYHTVGAREFGTSCRLRGEACSRTRRESRSTPVGNCSRPWSSRAPRTLS
jgi:hypothetical protein